MEKPQTEIVRDAVRRFGHLPDKTLARHILLHNGPLFDNDLEKIRSSVRHFRGHNGNFHRTSSKDKSLYGKVELPPTWRKIRTPYKLPPGLWLVLSDLHIPFHEPGALDVAIKHGQEKKVDGILINGDLWDAPSVGFWREQKRDFDKELDDLIDTIDFIRQEFPKQHIVYKPGNHEFRLPSYIITHAPELSTSPLTAMETLFDFEGNKIEFLDYYQKVNAGKLSILHGHEIRGLSRMVNPARGLLLKSKAHAAVSHCHTTSEDSRTDINGNILAAWSFGCLSDLSPDYKPYVNEWTHGIALINIEKNGDFEVENRRIIKNRIY